jgi:hypothetical protein
MTDLTITAVRTTVLRVPWPGAARSDYGGCQPKTRQAVKTGFELKRPIADRLDIVFEDGAAVQVANRRDAIAFRQIARRNPHHLE